MKKKTVFILAAIAALALPACGSDPAPSSAGSNPAVSSGGASSSEPEPSSGPAVSSGGASSSEPGPSSSEPIAVKGDPLNVFNVASTITYAASKYDKSVTVDNVIAKARALDPELSESAEDSEVKTTERDLLLLLYAAFKEIMPPRIGARTFQGYEQNLSKLTMKDSSTDSGTYTAVVWLHSLGLFNTRSTNRLNAKTAIRKDALITYLDRIHAYIGQSEVDDFYSTVNHDYLYDDCAVQYSEAEASTTIEVSSIEVNAGSTKKVYSPADFPISAATNTDGESITTIACTGAFVSKNKNGDKIVFSNETNLGFLFNEESMELTSVVIKGVSNTNIALFAGDVLNPRRKKIEPTIVGDTYTFDLTGYHYFRIKALGTLNVYDSNLIPQAPINEWANNLNVPAAKNFDETFFDQAARVPGNSSGLVAAITPYLEAETISDFIEQLSISLKTTGYCPLWGDIKFGSYSWKYGDNTDSLFNRQTYIATSYSYTGSSGEVAEGTPGYLSSVKRFKGIFKDVLGCSDEQAEAYAKDYTLFKYHMAIQQSKYSDGSGKYYTPALTYRDEDNVEHPEVYGEAEFNMYNFLKDAGVKDPAWFMFSNAQDTEAIMSMFSDTYLPYLKGLVIWQYLQHFTICLPNGDDVMAWAYNDGYSNDPEIFRDDDRYAYYILPYLSGNLTNYYEATPEYEAKVQAAVGVLSQLKSAMSARIDAQDWLSSDGKAIAHRKLNNLSYSIAGTNSDGTKIQYVAPAYKSISEGGSLFGNIAMYELANFQKNAAETGDDWSLNKDPFLTYAKSIDPLTANAFFLPSGNGIDITMGYMAAYIDVDTMSDEERLASYGWVVGHELSHGYDSNGVLYDENGTYNMNLFSEADKNGYQSRLDSVVSLYDGYEVMPERKTPGKTVQTEAVADITGLRLSLDIAKGIPSFDYRKFFERGAENYGFYSSQYTYGTNLVGDEHPVGRARANTAFMTTPEFYEAIDVQEGDNMWLAPEDRPTIW